MRECGSSGYAVAVVSGLCFINYIFIMPTIGFDCGGSIRIPASMCGIHGVGGTCGRSPIDIGGRKKQMISIPIYGMIIK